MPSWRLQLESDWGFAHLISDTPPESIRVDVTADGARDFFMPDVLEHHVRLDSRWSPEWQWRERLALRRERPDGFDWKTFHNLEEAGLVQEVEFDDGDLYEDYRGEVFRLTDRAMHYVPLVDRFCECLADPNTRVLMAAAIGDWVLADEASDGVTDSKAVCLISERATECRPYHTPGSPRSGNDE